MSQVPNHQQALLLDHLVDQLPPHLHYLLTIPLDNQVPRHRVLQALAQLTILVQFHPACLRLPLHRRQVVHLLLFHQWFLHPPLVFPHHVNLQIHQQLDHRVSQLLLRHRYPQ